MTHRAILNRRLQTRARGPWDVLSTLAHFALINYALPKERLARYIPAAQFDIPEFSLGGQRLALLSAVPFLDVDFHFPHFFPFLKFKFGQTNYRAYVIDKRTGEHGVWFFGTTLGSAVVQLPRRLWRIPWHYARYQIDCHYDPERRQYTRYRYAIESDWGDAQIELEDTGQPLARLDGFSSLDELKLILTHPVDGFFHRLDGRLGGYSVWHQEMPLTLGRARQLYFGLFERLGLLSKDEMQQPHSIFLCPQIEFEVYLPPKALD